MKDMIAYYEDRKNFPQHALHDVSRDTLASGSSAANLVNSDDAPQGRKWCLVAVIAVLVLAIIIVIVVVVLNNNGAASLAATPSGGFLSAPINSIATHVQRER